MVPSVPVSVKVVVPFGVGGMALFAVADPPHPVMAPIPANSRTSNIHVGLRLLRRLESNRPNSSEGKPSSEAASVKPLPLELLRSSALMPLVTLAALVCTTRIAVVEGAVGVRTTGFGSTLHVVFAGRLEQLKTMEPL